VVKITYLGHSSFKIVSKKTVLVTDPFAPYVGFPFPKVKADVVTVSHQHEDHNQAEAVKGEPFVAAAPGEYEIAGIDILGLPSFHDGSKGGERGKNVIYQFLIEGMTLLHCGDLGHDLSHDLLDELGEIDILMIPVGGYYTIGPKTAHQIITAIEPGLVIPMHYRTKDHDPEIFGRLKTVEDFLEEVGAKGERRTVLEITRADLPEETQVVVMERSG
jgi:L-ascorbate metabolism protein UlaG (beta-lactamase superfamily)